MYSAHCWSDNSYILAGCTCNQGLYSSLLCKRSVYADAGVVTARCALNHPSHTLCACTRAWRGFARVSTVFPACMCVCLHIFKPRVECPFSAQALAPEWESAATTLAGKEPKITLANVDCTLEENKPLATEFGIKGFPTIKVQNIYGMTCLQLYPRQAQLADVLA